MQPTKQHPLGGPSGLLLVYEGFWVRFFGGPLVDKAPLPAGGPGVVWFGFKRSKSNINQAGTKKTS